jgi:nicotinamide-nucleotide adenylyltransferase
MKALFIGRFQPFHYGHLKLLQSISKRYQEIVIGIGSSQYKGTDTNPFSYEERKKMIESSLDRIGIHNYKIIPIPDIHNPPKWVSHVLSLVPSFDVVVSNNSFTLQLFKEKGFSVESTPFFEGYSGREIRKKIREGQPWEDLVPPEVSKIIKEKMKD